MDKEKFEGWKNSPTTIEIFKEIEGVKAFLLERLADGQTLTTTAAETAMKTAEVVGNIRGLNQLLNISYEDDAKKEDISD